MIDETSKDAVIDAGFSTDATDRARATVESFQRVHRGAQGRDHRPPGPLQPPVRAAAHASSEIKELAERDRPPAARWTPERLWEAYETLDRSKVRGSGRRVLTDLVSLVRFALEQDDELVPYPELVRERFDALAARSRRTPGGRSPPSSSPGSSGSATTSPRRSAITPDDFEYTPFVEHGGLGKATQLFGDELTPLLDELTEALVA